VSVTPGDTVKIAGYRLKYKGTDAFHKDNYDSLTARFELSNKTKYLNTLLPEKRSYPIQKTTMTEAAIDGNLFRDIYVALGKQVAGRGWTVRIYYKPFVRWIWGGGLLILLGGILAGIDRRYRF